MKKSNLFMLSAAAMLLGTACSQEDVIPAVTPDGDGNVTFTIRTDGATGSRAFGDGYTALKLQYAVYEAGSPTPIITVADGDANQVTFAENALSTTVSLKLVNGKNYDILFWADNENAPYTFDAAAQTVTIDYTAMPAVNDEERDAFYVMENTGVISGPINKTVVLKRPFAQVNLGTDDLTADEVVRVYGEDAANLRTSVKVKAYSTLNLATKEVGGETELAFTAGAIPTDETFPVENYEYLHMNYLLVPQTQSSVADFNFTLAVADNSSSFDFDVTNVPLQANYRTNIYGSLLTNPAEYIVTKDPIFETPDFNKEVVVAKTGQEFVDALADNSVGKIQVSENIDLSTATPEQLKVTSDKTIEMADNASLTLPAAQHFEAVSSDLTIIGGRIANVDADGNPLAISRAGEEDPMKGVAKSLIEITDGNLILKGVELVNDMNHHWHGPKTNSAAIAYWGNCEINIEDSKIYSGEFTLCGMGRGGVNTSVVNLKNSYFESTSSNINNGTNWAYCMRLFGKEGVLENCEVKGIQGAVSPEEGTFTFKGGKYYTVNTPGRQDAFYALYATNGAKIIIEDGDFYGPEKRTGLAIEGTSCVVSGDNDTGLPVGSIVDIQGGRFSGKAYVGNRICDEFDWIETSDPENPLIKWTVAPN